MIRNTAFLATLCRSIQAFLFEATITLFHTLEYTLKQGSQWDTRPGKHTKNHGKSQVIVDFTNITMENHHL